jgi:hypothetical protein
MERVYAASLRDGEEHLYLPVTGADDTGFHDGSWM